MREKGEWGGAIDETSALATIPAGVTLSGSGWQIKACHILHLDAVWEEN